MTTLAFNELIAITIVNMIAEKPTVSLNTVNIREMFLKLVKWKCSFMNKFF